VNIKDRNICIWCAIKEGATQTSMAVKYNTPQSNVSKIYNEMENRFNEITEYEEIEGIV
jgi:hypothetical protein